MKAPKFTRSILKNNKLFSAALLLIDTLVMALLVMMSFFSESIDLTFRNYMDDYGYPDAYVVTGGTPASLTETIADTEGVESVWGALSAELSTELSDGRILSLRYTGTGSGDFFRYYDVDTGASFSADDETVAVYYYFARANGIAPGDQLMVRTTAGTKELTVTNIVSTPETITVGRDSSSWYDLEDYAYIYVPQAKMEELTGAFGLVNQFRLRFVESADPQTVLDRVLEKESLNAVSSVLYENSMVKEQLHAAIDSTKAIVSYVPAFIVLMGVLFSALFMGQIIRRSGRTIALLRSLGYSSGRISGIYVRYSLILSAISALSGSLLGFLLLKLMLQIYQGFYELPYLNYTGQWWMLLLLFLVILGIGVLSCLICSGSIGRVDPAFVFGRSMESGGEELPRWLEKARLDAYTRISLCSAWRSRRRSLVTVLCCIACLILTFLAVAILFTKSAALDYVFEQRYPYDLLAVISSEQAGDQLSRLSCVEAAEKRVVFSTDYEGEVMRIEAIPGGSMTDLMDTDYQALSVPENGIILEEGFARRHGLRAGSTVEVEGVALTVKGISRQYLCSVQYISFEQAQSLGLGKGNALAVRLQKGSTLAEFSRAADETEGYCYLIDMSHRRACASDALQQLNMPCYVFIVFAFIVGMVILCNMGNITFARRKREYASLRLLGVQPIRFLKMTLLENAMQYALTCVLGIPLSIWVSRFLLTAMSSVTEEYVLESVGKVSLISCVVMLLYMLTGVVITQWNIRNLNTLEVLGDKE